MIPKKIHYCWLSGEEMPLWLKKCMKTWKDVMPDYELVLWDKKKFDVTSLAFLEESCKVKRWAFAADYIRLYALYNEGGIYLDTDVIIKKRFDDFLIHDFFSGIEWHYGMLRKKYIRQLQYKDKVPDIIPETPWIGIQAAIMGSMAGHPFLKDCLDWYQDNEHSIQPEKIITDEPVFEVLAPEVYATIALKYGFQYKNLKQELLQNIVIYPSSTFAGNVHQAAGSNYAIHCCATGWRERKKNLYEKFKQNKLYKKLAQNMLLRKLLGKKPLQEQIDSFDIFQKFYDLI